MRLKRFIQPLAAVVTFYVDGFRSMTSTGRALWLLIFVKLFFMFAIMKLFFFPDILSRDYDTDAERAQAVREQLTAPVPEIFPKKQKSS